MTDASAVERFNGPVGRLFVTLRVELMERGRGVWVRRELPRGFVVSLMRRETDGRRVILLSRSKEPGEPRVFDREVTSFVDLFGGAHWEKTTALKPDAFHGIDAKVWRAYIEPYRRRAAL